MFSKRIKKHLLACLEKEELQSHISCSIVTHLVDSGHVVTTDDSYNVPMRGSKGFRQRK